MLLGNLRYVNKSEKMIFQVDKCAVALQAVNSAFQNCADFNILQSVLYVPVFLSLLIFHGQIVQTGYWPDQPQ